MVTSAAQHASPQPPTSLCQNLRVLLNAEHMSSIVACVLHAVEQHTLWRACRLQVTADDASMGGLSTSTHASASPTLTVSCSCAQASRVKAGDEHIPGLF